MNISQEQKGEAAILSQAIMWGLFPVITAISYSFISPLVSLVFNTLFAAIFFAGMLTVKKRWQELKNSNALKYILFATLILGIIYYGLYFSGLRLTSPGNASIIALSEIFFGYLFFNIWKKEYFSGLHIFGTLLVVCGVLTILLPNRTGWNRGDLIIILASAIAPAGNYFMQKARKQVSSESIMFVRSFVTFIVMGAVCLTFRQLSPLADIKHVLPTLLFSGLILMGFSKILWIEGIHRISVTKAYVLGCLSPVFALLFAYLLQKQNPTWWQLLSFIPMFFGIVLLTHKTKPTVQLEENYP